MKYAIVDGQTNRLLVTSDSFDIVQKLLETQFRNSWHHIYKVISWFPKKS